MQPPGEKTTAIPATDLLWYIARNNQKLGPFSWRQIQDMAKGGMLQISDMLLKQGARKWQELSDFLGQKNGPASVQLPNMVNTLYEESRTLELYDYKQHLLIILRKLPPQGFERLCKRLLQASGFEQVEVTGRSGDDGIDGIGVLKVNAFVTLKIVFQCKRYAGRVGSPEIRNFRGAMQGRASRGVFLTTGVFTEDARKEASRDGVPPIKLMDWEQLLQLFEEMRLGLVERTTYDIDRKFFLEFQNLAD